MLLGFFIFKKGDDGLSKFCTACGLPLQENVKFCTGCGAPVRSTEAGQEAEKAETVPKEPEQRTPVNVSPAFAQAAARLLPTSRAAVTAGEMALPQEMFPLAVPEFTNVSGFLGSGVRQILPGFKAAFRDRRRLIAALVLAVLWIVFIFLPPAVTDAVPAKLLSWLTFAQGGLQGGLLNKLGGIVGKGLLAAFFTSLLVDKSTWSQMKAGISAVTGGLKGDQATIYRWLLGMALALILYNLMVGSTSLQNSMASIACLGLSLRSLAGAGRSEAVNISGMHRFMSGWGTGFALAFVLSVLPGAFNGYILGGVLLIAAVIAKLTGRQREEVPAP
jgi:hypothetical protein